MPSYLAIIIAFAILFALGAIFGLALYFASIFLAVKEDRRIKAVAAMLPNANCGACGHPGCLQMAEALVKGEEKDPSACKPGKEAANFAPIREYLKSHPEPIYEEDSD